MNEPVLSLQTEGYATAFPRGDREPLDFACIMRYVYQDMSQCRQGNQGEKR